MIRDSSTFSHTCIFFLLTLSLLFLISSLLWLFPPLLFHLSILSEGWLLNFFDNLLASIGIYSIGNLFGGLERAWHSDQRIFCSIQWRAVKSSEERVVRRSATLSETHSEMQWIELRYSLCMSSFIYPVVVAWTWGGGWLSEFLKVGFTDLAGAFVKLLERSCSSCSSCSMFPAVTVRCWVPGLGVVCRFWSNPKTRTKPQRWKPGTCCWVAKLG